MGPCVRRGDSCEMPPDRPNPVTFSDIYRGDFPADFCIVPHAPPESVPHCGNKPKSRSREGSMNEQDRRESGHLMLITPDRVFYAGLLGRPRQRCPGAFHVYVSIEGGLWLTSA